MFDNVRWLAALLAVVAGMTPVCGFAQQPAGVALSPSKAQQTLEQAGKEGLYTFLVFYRQNDDATRAMASAIKDGIAGKEKLAVATYVQVTDQANQALVAKYDVSRAPLPMAVVVGPNGAMTGIFAQKVTPESVNDAFVTPTMLATMKSLQEGKLVLVTVQGSAKGPAPVALRDFQSDPHFKDRIVPLSMTAADPRETKFIGQMQIDAKATVTQTVLLAPPGVLVGKFNATTSKNDIAAALAKAGKCCDDPNCQHHQPATQPSQGARR